MPEDTHKRVILYEPSIRTRDDNGYPHKAKRRRYYIDLINTRGACLRDIY